MRRPTSAPGTACFRSLAHPLGSFSPVASSTCYRALLTDAQFVSFGWRLPFLASAVLVAVGFYVRLTISETPVFKKALESGKQEKVPLVSVFRNHSKALFAGTLLCLATFVLFYLMTVFALSWGTSALGFPREKFLIMQLADITFFALTIPISALMAERGRRPAMLWITGGDFPIRLCHWGRSSRPAPGERSA